MDEELLLPVLDPVLVEEAVLVEDEELVAEALDVAVAVAVAVALAVAEALDVKADDAHSVRIIPVNVVESEVEVAKNPAPQVVHILSAVKVEAFA